MLSLDLREWAESSLVSTLAVSFVWDYGAVVSTVPGLNPSLSTPHGREVDVDKCRQVDKCIE